MKLRTIILTLIFICIPQTTMATKIKKSHKRPHSQRIQNPTNRDLAPEYTKYLQEERQASAAYRISGYCVLGTICICYCIRSIYLS